jgi:hypothetical protein
VFQERLAMTGLDDPALADELAEVFIISQKSFPGREPEEIITRIMRAQAAGQLPEVKARLGIQ